MRSVLPNIDEVIEKTSELPVRPEVADRVAIATLGSETTAADLVAILMHCPPLSLQVLRLANSPIYGMAGKVVCLREAVVLVGMTNLRRVLQAAATFAWMPDEAKPFPYQARSLWLQATSLAEASGLVAERSGVVEKGLAQTAGLFAEIGRWVLSMWFEHQARVTLTALVRQGVPYQEAEKRIWRKSHAQIGADLIRFWGLPDELAVAIQFHHEPSLAGDQIALSSAIWLGEYLLDSLGIGASGRQIYQNPDPITLETLDISTDDLDEIINLFMEKIDGLEADLLVA
ncbi:MAG: HDOD domain-containing protein [Armatimonadetes bacterium]|nr:HDOD domain-containing protein [Armatimonadota bacterium]